MITKQKKSDNYIPKSIKLNINDLSKVNQKEKNKYCILMHINGIYKNGTDEPICKAGIEMQAQRMDMQTQQRKKGGG